MRLESIATEGTALAGQRTSTSCRRVDRIASASRRPAAITGYVDEDDSVVCAECWNKEKAIGGAASVLDTVDPADPADTTPFWVVDRCVRCGQDVKYKDIKLLA